MAMNCPLCYQDYAMGSAEGDTVPRQLPCGDVTCTSCLKDVLVEAELVCQLCMKTYQFNDVTEIPVWGGPAADDDHSDTESLCSEASDVSYNSLSDTDDTASDASDRSPRQSLSPTAKSKLAEFMEASATGAGRPVRRASSADEKKPPKSCTIPGCPNKRGPRGYCASHSSTHMNVESAKRATRKLERAKLSRLTFKPGDRLKEMKDSESASPWGRVDPDELAARFKRHELMELGEVLELIDQSRAVLMKESNVITVQAPITAVGDIHGQFFDLLHLLENGGKPGVETSYLFLGDYVDRGKYSCEVILYLLALKVQYPKRIFLIRGNHESRGTTSYFGFKEECKAKYGLPVYYRFLLCFECLPLCALIQTNYGRIFACHGGISPGIRTLDEIESISRFVEPECKGSLCDILWSDPLPESHAPQAGGERFEEFMSVEWKPNYERGCSFYFGYRAVRRFLDENDLLCLVRAHQVQEEGYRRHFYSMESSTPLLAPGSPLTSSNVRSLLPPVITIFSAPDYCERYGNKAAFLRIGPEANELSFEQFECTPRSLPGGMTSDLAMASAHNLAIIKTCPYMPTTFRELFKVAMELGAADAPASPSTLDTSFQPLSVSHADDRCGSPDVLPPSPPPASPPPTGLGGSDSRPCSPDPLRSISPSRGFASRNSAFSGHTPSTLSGGAGRRVGFTGSGDKEEAMAGKKEEKGMQHRAFFHSDPGKALRTPRTDEQQQHPPANSSQAAGRSSGSSESTIQGHHRISVIRSPQHRAGTDERRKTFKKSTVKREIRSEALKTRSSLYMLAAARDGINEMHPEILEKRMLVIADELKLLKDKEEKASGLPGAASQDAHNIEGRRFSVSELCHRFEKGMLGERLAEDLEQELSDSEPEGDATTTIRHRRHASLDNLKLTASSVTELRDFFELLSRKNAERRQGDKPSPGTRRSSGGGGGGGLSSSQAGRGKELSSSLQPIPEAATVIPEAVSAAAVVARVEAMYATGGPSMGTPAVEMFTHDEIVTLRLIFSLFDDNGDDYLDMQELVRYSEETGDYALPSQAMECIRVIDVDGDGRIGLWDYINFAARLKELHRANQHALVMCEIKKRTVSGAATV